MSEEIPKSPTETGLRTQREVGLANLPNCGFSPLSEIVTRSLVHIQTSKAQCVLQRIGEHDLFWPDYQLVCAWAEELKLTKEEALASMLSGPAISRSTLTDGHFSIIQLNGNLPVSSFPPIAGLMIERLDLCQSVDLSGLKTKSLPNLIELSCVSLELKTIDLSPFPNLERLQCQDNQLTQLDLSCVPNIRELLCWDNPLAELDLSEVPNLVELHCGYGDLHCAGKPANLNFLHVPNLEVLICFNMNLLELDLAEMPNLKSLYCCKNLLTKIDLSEVPNLERICCDENQLKILDISHNAKLKELDCTGNLLTELDIRKTRNLETLKYDPATRLIQRPDQNF